MKIIFENSHFIRQEMHTFIFLPFFDLSKCSPLDQVKHKSQFLRPSLKLRQNICVLHTFCNKFQTLGHMPLPSSWQSTGLEQKKRFFVFRYQLNKHLTIMHRISFSNPRLYKYIPCLSQANCIFEMNIAVDVRTLYMTSGHICLKVFY